MGLEELQTLLRSPIKTGEMFLLRPMNIIIVVFLASVLNVNASFIWAQKLKNLDKIHDTKLESNL